MRPYSVQSKQHVRMSVPNNNLWPTIKKLEQNIIKFPYSSYPFPNQHVEADLFNTMVQCNISEQKIDKIVNFKCQNVINLKKIVKIKMKEKKLPNYQSSQKSKGPVSTYSFFYEKVQYSLAYVLESKGKQNVSRVNKFNFDRAQIKKTLANVIAALFKQGIIDFLQFSQIGVNQSGILKIYIAPNVLFDKREYNPKTKILVVKYLNQTLKQIDLKFPKTLKSKNSLQSFKSQQISIEKDIIESEQSFIIDTHPEENKAKRSNLLKEKKKILFEHDQKSFNEQQQNFIGASGSTNLNHLKLQNQMKKKFQNHKFAAKAEQNINSQKKSRILSKTQQKQKINELSFQLQQIRKKIRQKVQQKRDKNIYTSKAFQTMATQNDMQYTKQKPLRTPKQQKINHSPFQTPGYQTAPDRKRKSSHSSINFYQGLIPNQKNINCINIYNPKNYNTKSQFLGADDAISIDTYQMEIGDDYEMPRLTIPTGTMRNSLVPNKARQSIQHKKSTDKQTSKLRFCQSAGGKSFGHIVALLKPQFEPKKSNIYEEPQIENLEDSKNSVSLKKSTSSKPSDQQSIEKRKLKMKNLSASENNLQKQIKGFKSLQQFKQDIKNLMAARAFKSPQQFTIPHQIDKRQTLPIQSTRLRNPQQQLSPTKLKQAQKASCNTLLKKVTLEQKVKKAMQRTKKAIDVLQKAKIRQSGSSNWLNGVII